MSAVDVTLNIVGTVDSLHLEPGDRIIVTIDADIAYDQIEKVHRAVAEKFAPHEVIVLANGLRLAKETHA